MADKISRRRMRTPNVARPPPQAAHDGSCFFCLRSNPRAVLLEIPAHLRGPLGGSSLVCCPECRKTPDDVLWEIIREHVRNRLEEQP